MGKQKTRRRKLSLKFHSYTFLVRGAFDFQHTFTSDEVKRAGRGITGFLPTRKAMKELEQRLFDALGYEFPVTLKACTGPGS